MKSLAQIFVFVISITAFCVTLLGVSGNNIKVDSRKLKNVKSEKLSKSISPDDSKSFEGIIELLERSSFDTVSYQLTIKQNSVKLDKNIKNGKPEESLLFDLEKETITALHHYKKMYCNIPVNNYNKVSTNEYKIIKSNNTKIISGFNCQQWRVKNHTENTEITFWVTGKKYYFYQKFVQLWNKTDNCYQYFLTIPDANGFMPIQQIERTLLRDIKSSITVSKIINQTIDNSNFEIPKTYMLYSN
ncbi:MAG: DUF4412 domain-containing protein [Bacteroidia bacterium]|nr:DUF4412 domain-containing protein [Bacteroidia bacterium]